MEGVRDIMEKFFYLEESPIYKGKYLIRMDHDKFLFPTGTRGSYSVFPARVLNLDYATYLRYVRDELGAELMGKNSKYVIPYFEMDKNSKLLIKLLNKRMEYIMNEQEFPFEYKEDEEGNIQRIPFEEL
jgi:hypothetical protein